MSGGTGLKLGDDGMGGVTSFGGGIGALSFGRRTGLSGSNCLRICWREASLVWDGDGDLGGGEGGDSFSEVSSPIWMIMKGREKGGRCDPLTGVSSFHRGGLISFDERGEQR